MTDNKTDPKAREQLRMKALRILIIVLSAPAMSIAVPFAYAGIAGILSDNDGYVSASHWLAATFASSVAGWVWFAADTFRSGK